MESVPMTLRHHNVEGALKRMSGFLVANASARTKMKLMNARANPVMRQSNVSFSECVNAPINAKQNAEKSIQPRAEIFFVFNISSMTIQWTVDN